MTGEFRRIATRRLWADGRMQALRRRVTAAHDLFVYLVTTPAADFTGLFPMSEDHAVADLCWSRRRFGKALQLLIEEGLVDYDPEAGVIYVPAFLDWQHINSGAQAVGAVKRLASLPKTRLLNRLRQDVIDRGLVEIKPDTRPLLDFLGVTQGQTQVTPPVTPDVTSPVTRATPSPVPSPPPSQSLEPSPSVRGNGPPRTPGEVVFEDLILPITHEHHKRDDWLKALGSSAARAAAERAVEHTRAAVSKGDVRNAGAFLWHTFQEMSRRV